MRNLEKMMLLCGEQVDGLLLTSEVSRRYAAQAGIAEGVAVVSKNGCRYFTDCRYIEAAQKQLQGFEVLLIDQTHSYSARINEAIADFKISALGCEEAYLTVGEFTRYKNELHAELIGIQSKLSELRWSKEPWEIERMLEAQEITDRTFTELLDVLHAGMTEKQLCAELIYRLYKFGADGLSFQPIVVSGEKTSMPHGVPGERVLKDGDFVTMDFGCLVDGYCSDMTRTVALGHADEMMREVYDLVLAAQKAGIAASRAGVKGQQIDAAARQVITEAGYGDAFGHGYGHSLGLEIHEAPNCNQTGETPIPLHAVCSAEPGIYLPDRFGVRIEDVVIFEENGVRDITQSPRELIIL